MGQRFCISVTFLADRYHGSEWPPSPARLFQALLAGSLTGSNRQHWPEAESALKLVERLPAPEILASDFQSGCAYRISVPNNDSDKAGREWSAGRPFDPSSIRTMKTVRPKEFAQRHDGRPHVCYLWDLAKSEPAVGSVRQLTSFMHTFGWGIDMAYADSFEMDDKESHALIADAGYTHYMPAENGKPYKIPVPGYLEDLSGAYKMNCRRMNSSGVDPAIRATSYGEQRYRPAGDRSRPHASFLLRDLNDSDKWHSVPWALGMKVAAWMRHAAAEALREEGYAQDCIDSYVLGHGNGHDRHMSFVPIPTIRTMHADGAIRRVLLVEPPDADGSISTLLQRKLAASDLLKLVNGGTPEPACSLAAARDNDRVLPRYLSTGHLWHSVTPVVLHGHNSERGRLSLKKTEHLLYQAFEKSGHSRRSIEELYFQPAPFWSGTGGALDMRVPDHLRKWPRYHVAVRFNKPVPGPVLIGIGQHYGVGLFAKAPE